MIKDRTLFGTKILNEETNKQGLLLFTWDNVFSDKTIPFATCVDEDGKKYSIELDKIKPIED